MITAASEDILQAFQSVADKSAAETAAAVPTAVITVVVVYNRPYTLMNRAHKCTWKVVRNANIDGKAVVII